MEKQEESLSDKIFEGRHHTPKNIFADTKELLPVDDVKDAVKKFTEDLRNCDEFFNVRDYNDTITTDKFMGIVELFLRKRFGPKLTK